jgi:hypothetical protein
MVTHWKFKMQYLIATAMKPLSREHCDNVFKIMRDSAADNGMKITKILWCAGPGCTNLAFEILGDEKECERFGFALNQHLQPAKWCETNDTIPDGFNCTLNFKGN